MLHDQTADRMVDVVSQLPHVNATIVPFHLTPGLRETPAVVEKALEEAARRESPKRGTDEGMPHGPTVPGTQPIAALVWRTRATVAGRVKSIRVQPLADGPTLECVLVDGSGEAITLVFLGRHAIAGVSSGTTVKAEGMVGKHRGKLAMINPVYELLSSSDSTGTR